MHLIVSVGVGVDHIGHSEIIQTDRRSVQEGGLDFKLVMDNQVV